MEHSVNALSTVRGYLQLREISDLVEGFVLGLDQRVSCFKMSYTFKRRGNGGVGRLGRTVRALWVGGQGVEQGLVVERNEMILAGDYSKSDEFE